MANNTEKRITAKMVLDSTGYNDKLKGLNAEMKKHQAELKLASEGIKQFGKDSEKLKTVQESLAKQVELHSKKVDIYKQSIEKTTSKMQDNIKKRDELKSSLEKANKKYEEAVKIYGKESNEAKKAKEEVDRLSKEHEKASKSVETNAKQIQNYETNLDKAKGQMVKTQGELKKVNSELDKSNNKWIKASEELKKSSEKLKNVGGGMEKAGDGILKVTAPLAAGGMASLKFSNDFEDAVAKVSTIADEKEVSVSNLRKGILKLSNDTGIASTEIANNVYDAISAGQKTGDAVNFVANSTKLAKAGFAEAGQSLDLLTTILNSYGMEAKKVTKVSDILINTQNLGKTTVGELSASMGKVIPTAKTFGVNLEQVASGYAIMTAKGVKSAETTTYMASMFNELGKSGTKASDTVKEVSGKSFQELIKSGKSVGDVLAMMDKHAKKNKLSLADMFGSAEAGKAALILSTNAGKDFNAMLKNMNNTAGKTDEAFAKVTNTRGERFKKSLNKIKNEAIRFGDAIAPMMDTVSKLIGKLADKLGGLSDKQLQNIAKWGAMAIATGGFLKIGGKAVSGIGKGIDKVSDITKKIGEFKGATKVAEAATAGATGKVGLLGKALGVVKSGAGLAAGGFAKLASAVGLSVPGLGLAVAGIGAVGYGAHKLNQHMKKEAVPSVDLFNEKVKTTKTVTDQWGNKMQVAGTKTVKFANETKKGVGAFVKANDQASKSIFNLCANQTKITENTAKKLKIQYTQLGNQIKAGEDQKYKERLIGYKKFLDNNKTLTAKEKAEALKKMEESHNNEKKKIDGYTKQINDILTQASSMRRELTADEQKKINEIQEKMKNEGVKKLSKTEEESKAILGRLKQYGTRITAEQASDVIKNAEKQRKKSVGEANKQYNETVAQIKKMRDEDKSITKDQADKMIAEAERQKKGSIDKAEQQKDGVVEQIKKMDSNSLQDIDITDGHIMTKWDKLKNWFKNNPITRWIKTKTSGDDGVGKNWTGTNYWQGGLTYLHDAPGRNTNYELYDLPRGTRIYNHDASEDLVLQTAESVATKVAGGILNNSNGKGKIEVIQHIYCPVPTPSELARQSKNNLKELGLQW